VAPLVQNAWDASDAVRQDATVDAERQRELHLPVDADAERSAALGWVVPAQDAWSRMASFRQANQPAPSEVQQGAAAVLYKLDAVPSAEQSCAVPPVAEVPPERGARTAAERPEVFAQPVRWPAKPALKMSPPSEAQAA